jgi:hypothetical protein
VVYRDSLLTRQLVQLIDYHNSVRVARQGHGRKGFGIGR